MFNLRCISSLREFPIDQMILNLEMKILLLASLAFAFPQNPEITCEECADQIHMLADDNADGLISQQELMDFLQKDLGQNIIPFDCCVDVQCENGYMCVKSANQCLEKHGLSIRVQVVKQNNRH